MECAEKGLPAQPSAGNTGNNRTQDDPTVPSPATQKLREARAFKYLMDTLATDLLPMREAANWTPDALVDRLLKIAGDGARLIEQDPLNRSWICTGSASLYGVLGRVWGQHCKQKEWIDPAVQAELVAVVTTLVSLTGIPQKMHNAIGLIGIDPDLDKVLVDSIIHGCLPGEAISIQGQPTDYAADEMLSGGYASLRQKLLEAGSVDLALDLMEALQFFYGNGSQPWVGEPLLRFGLEAFEQPLPLTLDQKGRFQAFFSNFDVSDHHFSRIGDHVQHLLNMAGAGLAEVAAPLMSLGYKHIEYFHRGNPFTFLIDVERLMGIDVAPMLTHWATLYNFGRDPVEALRVVVGYQLLTTAPTIQENLLEFAEDNAYKAFVEVISGTFGNDAGHAAAAGYPVNCEHLKSLVAEFMAQRPGAIKAMGSDPTIGPVASKLPGWYVDRLETDLGL
ncbi:hypothetical protein RBE51_21325 [Pseudomonas taiwanensis]|uniref:hypothetical protein n=1 Tax=Pseudomonas taiwanensis TaxID=470150 RepID=UPI0028DDE448|nr:hypothetical protein [Pseudomonas taiwanensis]MDT8925340.1 hypothetical protein [Pseudomonas taiwanensis]